MRIAPLSLVVPLLLWTVVPAAARQLDSLTITLVHGSSTERATRADLRRVVAAYPVRPWIFTRTIRIEDHVIPHSHPVLTLDTDTGDDVALLASFLHEQLHWYLNDRTDAVAAAIEELKQRYPEVPVGGGQGAQSEYSTYMHLLDCELEYEAVRALAGVDAARKVLSAYRHYQWIYQQVLDEGQHLEALVHRYRLTITPPPAEALRTDRRLLRTSHFDLYSDPRVNVHDFLYGLSRADEDTTAGAACLAALPDTQQAAWRSAVAFYRENMAQRHHRRDSLMVSVRNALASLPFVLTPDVSRVLSTLNAASTAYAACWWPSHDAGHRAWVDGLRPLLATYGDTLTMLLSDRFQQPWPDARIPVDLVTYASPGGANTRVGPAHMMLSTVNPGYQHDAALEMIFHEASHTIFGGGFGALSEALEEASAATGIKYPSILPHVLLFYTVGETVRTLLSSHDGVDYEPYVYARGLFVGVWKAYREPVETAWQPYLDGSVDMRTAAENLLKNL